MRKIIDDKLYDTEKCTKILDYETKIKHKTIFGDIFKYHINTVDSVCIMRNELCGS